MYIQARASARRPLIFSRRLKAPPSVASVMSVTSAKAALKRVSRRKYAAERRFSPARSPDARRCKRQQQGAQRIAGDEADMAEESAVETLQRRSPAPPAISSWTNGWQRIAPCPKMMSERVRMLAPSTVMPIGAAT